jgi:uncharacterized paraquat-inducible protein A
MSEENLKEKIIIECPNKDCRQKLGIPKTTDTLRVNCPRCGTSFLYPTQKIYKKKTELIAQDVEHHFYIQRKRYIRKRLLIG